MQVLSGRETHEETPIKISDLEIQYRNMSNICPVCYWKAVILKQQFPLATLDVIDKFCGHMTSTQ
jgi:hypothetical protein